MHTKPWAAVLPERLPTALSEKKKKKKKKKKKTKKIYDIARM
jgi:hypothetical protein